MFVMRLSSFGGSWYLFRVCKRLECEMLSKAFSQSSRMIPMVFPFFLLCPYVFL